MWGFSVLNLNIEWQRFSLIALILVLMGVDYRQGRLTWPPLRQMRPALVFFVFFILLCLFAAILLLIDERSLRTTRNWFTFCLIGLGVVHYLGWKGLGLSLIGLCAGVVVSTLLWLLYIHYPEYSLLTPVNIHQHDRLALYMDHPNNLGTMMGWGCCLWFFIRCGKQRIVSPGLDWLLLLMVAVPLCLSWSRSNLFATVGTALFIAIAVPRFSLKKLLLTAASVAAALVIVNQMPLPEQPQLRRLVSAMQSPLEETTIKSRLPIWEIALHGYKQSPVYGNGLQSYTRLHREYLKKHRAELEKKYPIVETDKHRAHSLVLGVMSDMGSIGLILLIGMYAAGVMAGYRLPAPYKIGLAGLLFIFVVGLAESVLSETAAAMVLFTSCGGMLAGYLRRPEPEKTGR
ncbi:MAG: O-antigen ligase family protein [Deltaproteobacteria bacterium]|nr:O-antigen ligase family protein [Deltaproteobacteria bacterium]